MAEFDESLKFLSLPSFKVVKKTNTCFVIETAAHFYKVTLIDSQDPRVPFQHVLSKAYAEEFNRMGLDWTYSICRDGSKTYAVERREKLKVLRCGHISLENAARRASTVTRRVERKLGFPQLTSQVRQVLGYDSIERICVARDAETTHENFAMFEDEVIELGTSNRFLALIGNGGKFHRHHSSVVHVKLKGNGYYFAPQDLCEEHHRFAEELYRLMPKWWLYSEQFGEKLVSERQKTCVDLANINSMNVKILTLKEPLPVRSREDHKQDTPFQLIDDGISVLELGEGD